MAFSETFSDLRKRRRIPMRLFEEEAEVSRSYIHGIEQGKLLPSPKKLEKLAQVFVTVAEEQEAADPQSDAKKLFDERERTAVTDRLGFDPKLADSLISLRNLNARQRADLAQPLFEALRLFEKLGPKERTALGPFIKDFVDFYLGLESEEQSEVVLKIYRRIFEVREETETKAAKGVPKKAPKPSRPAKPKNRRKVSTARVEAGSGR
jgi:transcriptional regulator with XRE-family HTH domain